MIHGTVDGVVLETELPSMFEKEIAYLLINYGDLAGFLCMESRFFMTFAAQGSLSNRLNLYLEDKMKAKKILVIALAMIMAMFVMTACGGDKVEGPEVPEAGDLGAVMVYVDGVAVNEEGMTLEDMADVLTHTQTEDGTFYYGVPVADLADAEIAGVYFQAEDGFMSYGAADASVLTVFSTDTDGVYQPVMYNEAASFGGFVDGGIFSSGVKAVYLTTTASDWSVDIQVDGESVGTLTVVEFMQKTPVNGNPTPTAMYDASFMYKQGQAEYKGQFLGFGLDQMVAKLNKLEMGVPTEYTNVEVYGVNGMGQEGLNAEYSTDAASPWYYGNMKFFTMYDGKTYCEIGKQPVGLTAFLDGQGMRWTTYNVTTLNFVTK